MTVRLLILTILLSFTVAAKTAAATFVFDQLNVSGPCEITLIENPDSTGIVAIPPGQKSAEGLEVRRAGDALYVSLPANSLTQTLLHIKIYHTGRLNLINASGRAVVQTSDISDDHSLSIISSGAASLSFDHISAKNINISLSGSGKITLNGPTEANNLNLSLTGGGKISANKIAVDNLTVTQRGSGKISLAGSAHKCAVAGFGSGTVDARKLVSSSMDLKQFATGQIFFPAGIPAKLGGKTDNIHSTKYNYD